MSETTGLGEKIDALATVMGELVSKMTALDEHPQSVTVMQQAPPQDEDVRENGARAQDFNMRVNVVSLMHAVGNVELRDEAIRSLRDRYAGLFRAD